MTIDASRIKNLGNPRWLYSTAGSTEKAQSSITETISNTPLLICLKVIDNSCDRYFIISDTAVQSVE
jgi:hypothetical protein